MRGQEARDFRHLSLISQLLLTDLAPSPLGRLLQFHRAGPSTAPDKALKLLELRGEYNVSLQFVKTLFEVYEPELTVEITIGRPCVISEKIMRNVKGNGRFPHQFVYETHQKHRGIVSKSHIKDAAVLIHYGLTMKQNAELHRQIKRTVWK